jgi:hypothetical protein
MVRFWRVPVQIPGEVPEGSGEGFRRRNLARFRKFSGAGTVRF